ncbi:MAG: cobalt transporter subunit [Rhodospirillaceae bacterium]|nr:MAG: cobalt transporter subunit [Rhodospirillaceae bacterium]
MRVVARPFGRGVPGGGWCSAMTGCIHGPWSDAMTATTLRSFSPFTVLSARLPALFALVFGTVLVFGVGFASPGVIHNAAHDVRHAFAFPCH